MNRLRRKKSKPESWEIKQKPLKQTQKFQSRKNREVVVETKDLSMKRESSTVFNALKRSSYLNTKKYFLDLEILEDTGKYQKKSVEDVSPECRGNWVEESYVNERKLFQKVWLSTQKPLQFILLKWITLWWMPLVNMSLSTGLVFKHFFPVYHSLTKVT